MTGAGAPGGPGIIKALVLDRDIELIVCDADPHASGRFLGVHFIQIPKAENPNFIDHVLKICVQYSIDIIFPLVTMELFKFSSSIQTFNSIGIKVIVSELKSLTIANSKGDLLSHLREKNVLVPVFKIVNNREELINACIGLDYPKNDLVVKPCISNGSRGIRILSNKFSEFDLLFNHKPNSLYTTLEKYLEIIAENEIPQLLVSEYLPGDEYTIDTIVKNGDLKLIIPRKRIKMLNGISIAGKFINNDEIINYTREIIGTLNLDGPIGLQVKSDVNGIFKILEINPRIQGTSVSALGVGVNLPLISIYNGMNICYNENFDINWGTSFIRYYNEAFF